MRVQACGFHKDAQARVEIASSEKINPTGSYSHFSVRARVPGTCVEHRDEV